MTRKDFIGACAAFTGIACALPFNIPISPENDELGGSKGVSFNKYKWWKDELTSTIVIDDMIDGNTRFGVFSLREPIRYFETIQGAYDAAKKKESIYYMGKNLVGFKT